MYHSSFFHSWKTEGKCKWFNKHNIKWFSVAAISLALFLSPHLSFSLLSNKNILAWLINQCMCIKHVSASMLDLDHKSLLFGVYVVNQHQYLFWMGTFGVKLIILFAMFTNHQIEQSDGCRWQLKSSPGICVGMYWLTYSICDLKVQKWIKRAV